MVNYPSGYGARPAYNAYSRYAQPISPSFGAGPFNPYTQQSPQALRYGSANPYTNSARPYMGIVSTPAWQSFSLNNPILPAQGQFFPPAQIQPRGWLPGMPYGYKSPQQPVVVTVNAPKWSDDDIRKNFWMKVAATTISFVAGIAIVGFVGLKILPERIAAAFGRQAHKSLLANLDRKYIHKYLNEIKSGALIGDSKTSKKLKDRWGQVHIDELYKNKKKRSKFLADIEPYVQIKDTLASNAQQVFDATITPEYLEGRIDSVLTEKVTDKLAEKVRQTADKALSPEFMRRKIHTGVENLLPPSGLQSLIHKSAQENVAFNEALKKTRYYEPEVEQQFSKLTQQEQQLVREALHEHVEPYVGLQMALGDLSSSVAQRTVRDVVRSTISPDAKQVLLQKVIDKPDIQALLQEAKYSEKGEILSALAPNHQAKIWDAVDKHLTFADYLGSTSSETLLTTLKETVINENNVAQLMECPSVSNRLLREGKEVEDMSLEARLAFAKQHLSKGDLSKFLENYGYQVANTMGSKTRRGFFGIA